MKVSKIREILDTIPDQDKERLMGAIEEWENQESDDCLDPNDERE